MTREAPARIGVLVEGRYLNQAQPAGLVAAVKARGHRVTLIDPQASSYLLGDNLWLRDLDLIVARGRSWGLLSLLGWAEARGTPTINRRNAIAAVLNKADMAVALAAGGVPTPPTFLGPVAELARQVDPAHFPLILKPIFGDNSRGLRVVRSPEELRGLEWPEPIALAQRFVTNDGWDLKLYAVGAEVWAVRKPSPVNFSAEGLSTAPRTPGPAAQVVPSRPAWDELARRCGALFGLEVFGLDCLETADGILVIEVNDFPNFSAIPSVDMKLADYVLGCVVTRDGPA